MTTDPRLLTAIMNHREVPPAPIFSLHHFLMALPVILLLATLLTAQDKPLSGKKLDEYLKALLTEYYTGKSVHAKVAIPTNGRGLQITDGRPETASTGAPSAAPPGTTLVIRQLRFKNKNIEVQFDTSSSGEASSSSGDLRYLTKTVGVHAVARINLRFSRSITSQDLTVPNINRLLSAAVDITALIPKATEPPATADTTPRRSRLDAAMLAERAARAQGIPFATVVSDLVGSGTECGEVTIECSATRARLYIDGGYSGFTPRTIKLLTGVHTILIVNEGDAMWEQKFFIPGGKASVVRAELKAAQK